jgi:predicted alpha/beta hydrolase family esterase
MEKKKVIIVHCWGGSKYDNWYQWLQEELEKKSLVVNILEMPNSENPKIEEWVSYLDNNVKNPDENTYFIGHSIGCQTIMRYLEQLPEKVKVGGVVFVAGWFNLNNLETNEELNIAKPWIQTPIDFEKIKEKTENINVILSRNEPFGYIKENSDIFERKLGAKVIIAKGVGHFENEKIPIILNTFLEMVK